MTIFIADNSILLFEKEEKKITYALNELKNYKIEYRSTRFYVFQITTISDSKLRFKCHSEENSINFLDRFNELVKNHNNNNEYEKRIDLIPPYEATDLNQRITNLIGILLAITFCLHLYYSATTSIFTFFGGLSYYLSAIKIRKSQIKFLEHLKSQNSIATFKEK
jgi:hypothetical protein